MENVEWRMERRIRHSPFCSRELSKKGVSKKRPHFPCFPIRRENISGNSILKLANS
jgi:hypothetical protein